MATYEEIYGKRVKEFDSDPTLESSYEGQVWYDKSTGVLKSVEAFASWSSTGNMPGTGHGNQGDGTQNAAFSCGGTVDSTNSTFLYSGFSWAASGNLGTHRYTSGANGTQTAGLASGGFIPASSGGPSPTANVEEFNGSTWSEQSNIPAATSQNTSVGT